MIPASYLMKQIYRDRFGEPEALPEPPRRARFPTLLRAISRLFGKSRAGKRKGGGDIRHSRLGTSIHAVVFR